MKNHRRTLFFLLGAAVWTIIACSAKKTPAPSEAHHPGKGDLHGFFSMCERDIRSAVKVINGRELIKNLTHLHKMNSGGKRYYLLEREGITEMIRSVTEGVYSDFILINRHGVVIYTMENDDIFGKNAVTGFNGSPLARCFSTKTDDVHVEDISMFPPLSGRYSLFIALQAAQDESFTGVFVLQVDSEKILPLLDRETHIISTDGKYRVTPRQEEMLAPYPQFDLIDQDMIRREGSTDFVFKKSTVLCSLFVFKNLSWILVTRH